jgi:hypothetical protein
LTHKGPFRYSAFLSYSHAADSAFAAELQESLQQFAKPYYARRALNIFRDQTDLRANPALWPGIAAALDASEFFLILASPRAAQSKWVKRELDHWLGAHAGEATNLILLWTDGELAWDDLRNSFDWSRTSALPRVLDWDAAHPPRKLDGVFTEEPFYLDFRWGRAASGFSIRDPRFLDQVATIASELRNEPKSELIGKDVREHRRFRKVRAAAIAVMSALAILAIAFGVVAMLRQAAAVQAQQLAEKRLGEANLAKEEAEKRRQEAERERNIAIWQSAALQATSDATNRSDDDQAALLAREALRLHSLTPTEPWYLVESALQNAASPRIFSHVFEGHSGGVKHVTFSRDGAWIASASGEDGTIRVWNLRDPSARPIRLSAPDVDATAFSPDGNWLAWTSLYRPSGVFGPPGPPPDTSSVWLADLHAPGQPIKRLIKIESSFGIPIAFSPDGMLAAEQSGNLSFWDPRHSVRPVRELKLDSGTYFLAFTAAGRLVSGDVGITMRDLSTSQQPTQHLSKPHTRAWFSAVAPDGGVVVYGGEDGKLYLWRTGEPDSEAIPFPQRAYILSASISPDGTRLAAGAGSNVWIWDLRHLDRSPITLAAHGAAVDSVAFSPDGKRLASGSADKTVRVREVASTLAETVDDRDQPRSNAVGSALLE